MGYFVFFDTKYLGTYAKGNPPQTCEMKTI